ncbi:GNAT family N-acetyltransferase [Eubacterium sp. 1001713B170207_170306_E7]|uniref:GNAT family N-acetyltransferase n=1 Tax=Eubacterium sp. 1001713B170207_170306_E7 TaxID=2787097 RepID=UPI00189B02AE|nr:GNAT family N-acetyltransferase [Eubacterium sp. 1001713B170207_170306_E7]
MDFKLRPWRESDIDCVAEYANNKKIADNLRNAFPWPYTREDARGYVMSCIEAGEARQCTRAIDIDGRAVGSIGIFLEADVYCKNAEIGYWLAEPFWGHGIMSAAIRELTGCALEHYGLARIHAEPFAHNLGSRRALEKAGYTLERILKKRVFKNGTIFDSCLYAFTR